MTFLFELKYALRLIARKPGHSILCVLVVAMSLGISLVIFSLVYNTNYKQLDFQNSNRWVYATELNLDTGFVNFADSIDQFAYQEMAKRVTSYSQFGAMMAFEQSRFRWDERTTVFGSVRISPNMLQAANFIPSLGRTFVPGDDQPTAERVVILSHSVWQNYYSGDLDIVGQQTRLDEVAHTIIGVMPEDVSFPVNFDLMLPLRLDLLTEPDLQARPLTPMGILAEGVGVERANEEIQEILAQLQQQNADFYRTNQSAVVRPLNSFYMEGSSILFSTMAATTLVILLLGCLNIANLLLSRGVERDQEFAIRNAIGSSRWLLIRQSLLESLLICVIGTLVGLLLAYLGLKSVSGMFQVLDGQIPNGLPAHWVFTLEKNTIFSALLFTACIWLFSGFMPAWTSSKPNVDEMLKGGSKGTTDKNRFRLSKFLVGFEIFSSCFLLVLCGGLLLSINNVVETDYGIELENRMVFDIEFPQIGYEDGSSFELFFDNLQRQAETNPDIEQLALTSSLPFRGIQLPYAVNETEPIEGVDYPVQYIISVSDNYFQALGLTLVDGRAFDSSDNSESLPVIVVDEVFAQSTWPNESALNKQVQLNPEQNGAFYTVVGVSSSTKQTFEMFGLETITAFYRPMSQMPSDSPSLIAITALADSEFLEAMQDAVSAVDSSVAVHSNKSLARYLSDVSGGLVMIGNVFLSVAVLTVVLAGTGIFAIITRSVIQRVREAGIRRALGSTNLAVTLMFLRQGLSYLSIGVLLGGGCALLVSSVLTSVFADLMSHVPVVYTVVVLGMALLIGLASWFPSRRAIALEPGEALHYE